MSEGNIKFVLLKFKIMPIMTLSEKEQARVNELQQKLDKLRSIEKEIVKELRQLIYKIERI